MESASAQIDTLIDRRAGERSKANELEAMYAESVRRHHENLHQANRALWLDFHLGQAERLRRTMTDLIEKHEEAAARLLDEAGEGEAM